jgi:pSer/pThr/pTyr-binding forkhead associated (FHA) protein
VTAGIGTVRVLATNYTAVLRPLQWLVIVLVFLFFLRVVRAVWVEVRPAGPRQTRGERRRAAREEARALAPPAPGARKKQLFLEVLEPDDQAGRAFELGEELTVGRSPGCGVATTYDVYSSTLHARIFRRGDRVMVEDLGSTNGTYVNSERITKPTRLSRGDLLQIGATVFEVTR